jgi:hypothetical protein
MVEQLPYTETVTGSSPVDVTNGVTVSADWGTSVPAFNGATKAEERSSTLLHATNDRVAQPGRAPV